MAFHGRQRELAMLDEAFRRDTAQLFVVYGRRGVGKTALLGQWLRTRKCSHIFWGADQRPAGVLLRVFSQAIMAYRQPGQPVAAGATFGDWDQAFSELGRLAESERLVVVLDEFTYLMASDPTLPSILQRLWDQTLKHTRLMLVLTGSHAGMIERDLLSYRAPLYHRFTAALHLPPLPYGSLAEFFPRYTPEERVEMYACLGGVPAYLELVDPSLSWRQNLPKLLTSKLVINDAGALLRDQLSEPGQYMAVVDTVASGFEQFGEVTTMAKVTDVQLVRYADVLSRLGILTRDVPATQTNPSKSRLGRYRVIDPYLRFYYKFLANERANLERGITSGVMQALNQHLPDFVGTHTFEELCREYLLLMGAAGRLPFVPRVVGSYWAYRPAQTTTGRPPQIDVVAINEDAHQIIAGECKWTGEAMKAEQVAYLIAQAAKMLPKPADRWTVTYAFFCRAGFEPRARAAAGGHACLWIELKQLDAGLRKFARAE
jgi:AAA+ ATPase superfamily predicted ATPase